MYDVKIHTANINFYTIPVGIFIIYISRNLTSFIFYMLYELLLVTTMHFFQLFSLFSIQS